MSKVFSWISLTLFGFFSVIAQAEEPTVEQMTSEIVGDWQVMSFQRKGQDLIDYSKDNVIWSFDENEASIQGAGFQPFKGSYKVVASRYRWIGITGVFLIVKGLNDQMPNYSRYGKLIARNLNDDGEMRIVNWEDNLAYTLKKVK